MIKFKHFKRFVDITAPISVSIASISGIVVTSSTVILFVSAPFISDDSEVAIAEFMQPAAKFLIGSFVYCGVLGSINAIVYNSQWAARSQAKDQIEQELRAFDRASVCP